MKNEITGLEVAKDTIWIDKYGKEFTIDEMDNEYVYNVCFFMVTGGGWSWFLTEKNINRFYDAALERFSGDHNTCAAISRIIPDAKKILAVKRGAPEELKKVLKGKK